MFERPQIHSLSKPWRFALLATLYFSQGVPFGLFVQALPVILREGGTSLQAIGLSSLLAIPWGLKFLWGPWVDRPLLGRPRRKGWLVPLQLVTMATLGGLVFIDPFGPIAPLLAGILFVNFLNATQDVATDGLAVEILRPEERGLGNGLQVGGYRVGMIFGGAGALVVIDMFGWTSGLALCIAALGAALLPVLWVREDGEEPADTAETPSGVSILREYFTSPGAGRIIALLVLYKFGDAMASGMLRPMLVDLKFTMADIGTIVGGVGFVAGLVGAAAGGLIADRTSRRRALMIGVAMQTVGGAFYMPLMLVTPSFWTASLMIGVEHFMGGIATVILFTCMMDWTRPRHTGADYTILASVVVVATGLASVASGFTAANLGYLGHLGLSVVLAGLGGAMAVKLFPTQRSQPL